MSTAIDAQLKLQLIINRCDVIILPKRTLKKANQKIQWTQKAAPLIKSLGMQHKRNEYEKHKYFLDGNQ